MTISNNNIWLIGVFLFACSSTTAEDDSQSRLHFRSGGSLEAQVKSESKISGRSYLVVRTENGTTMKLDKGRVIQRVAENGNNASKYLAKISGLPETADAHSQMYEWCKNNGGKSKFARQMHYHLKQIVRLDPSDSKAWQKLEYIRVDGRWVPEQQHYQSLGYVRSKGRWIPIVQLENNRQQNASTTHFNSRKKALKNWQKNVLKVKDFQTIRDELGKILDPSCVVYFTQQYMSRQQDPELRRLFIDAVADVKSRASQEVLVTYAIEDQDIEVQEHAMLMLEDESFDKVKSVGILSKRYLRHANNELVNRAAAAIGRFNDDAGIIPLIGAIVTKHKVATGDDPGRMNTSFGDGGVGFGTEGPSSVIVPHKNEQVRQALTDITGQDFRFDSELWKEWYIDQNTPLQTDLRRKSNK